MHRRSAASTLALLVLIGVAVSPVADSVAGPAPKVTAAMPAPRVSTWIRPTSGVFVIDQDNHSVVLFPGAGQAARPVVTGLTDPEQIAVDEYNNLYVYDNGLDELIKIAAATGTETILRSSLTQYPQPSMAVDGQGDLYLLDGLSIFKFDAATGVQTALGQSAVDGILTVDAAGDVSISGFMDGDDFTPVVETRPATGATPTFRSLGNNDLGNYIYQATETPTGMLYLNLYENGASGAQYIVRFTPGGTTDTTVNTRFAYYANAIDRTGNFFLMQSRYWCNAPALDQGQCTDDFAVDSILKFPATRAATVHNPISGVSVPFGGIAADVAGNVYAAETPVSWEPAAKNPPPAELVRIDAKTKKVTILAKGKYLMPTLAVTAPVTAPVVTAHTRGTTQAVLTWTAPTLDGGSPISGYLVGRNGTDTRGTGPWSTRLPATTSSFTFNSLKPGGTYVLSVSAANAIGSSATSSVTVHLPIALATAPRTLKVVVQAATHTATVSWTAPSSTGGFAVTGYRLARNGTDSVGTGPWSTTVAATARSLTFGNLVSGRTYTLSVAAITSQGLGAAAYGSAHL